MHTFLQLLHVGNFLLIGLMTCARMYACRWQSFSSIHFVVIAKSTKTILHKKLYYTVHKTPIRAIVLKNGIMDIVY